MNQSNQQQTQYGDEKKALHSSTVNFTTSRVLTNDERLHAARRLLEQKLQTDFIANRQKAFQEAGMKSPGARSKDSTTKVDPHWQGVSSWERGLVSFCQVPAVGEIDTAYNGALDTSLVMQFVGFVAMHCHDTASRALALAVLEQSLLADTADEEENAERVKQPVIEDADVKIPALDIASGVKQEFSACSTKSSQSPSKRGRLRSFFAAGGLKLLHRWLLDATTPRKTPPPATANAKSSLFSSRSKAVDTKGPEVIPSPLSALLLPLLNFLSDMPFDWKHVEESKLDKVINKLRRQIKRLAEEEKKDSAWKQKVYLLTGEEKVDAVKASLDRIRTNWKASFEAMKKNVNEQSGVDSNDSDPFLEVRALLQNRRAILENDGNGEKPEWLTKLQAKADKVEQKRKRKRLSTAELEKLERNKERSAMLKEDLEKALAYKRQCQIKLRELEKKKQEEKQGIAVHNSRSKNRVQWKDGLNTYTGGRNRSLLEQVFFIEARRKKAPVFDD
jgi:hypothetical protein